MPLMLLDPSDEPLAVSAIQYDSVAIVVGVVLNLLSLHLALMIHQTPFQTISSCQSLFSVSGGSVCAKPYVHPVQTVDDDTTCYLFSSFCNLSIIIFIQYVKGHTRNNVVPCDKFVTMVHFCILNFYAVC